MKNTIWGLLITGLLLFPGLVQGESVTASPEPSVFFDHREIYQLNSPGLATENNFISLPTLTVPVPVFHLLSLTFTCDIDFYEKRLFFFREYFFISSFLRNVFYVFTTIHAP